MDPKTANLDPKLKEVYDRVMGVANNNHPVNAAPPPPPPSAVPSQQPKETTLVADHEPVKTPSAFVAKPAKSNGGIPMSVIVLLLVVFLSLYTFFWLRIFNISLPFLPK